MFHKFDIRGWYAGSVDTSDPRTTEVEPENKSVTTVPGELRANFTGYVWIDTPYVEHIPPVPQKCTRRQALQALFLNGVTEQMVLDKINLLPSPQKELATIEFKESLEFERQRPLVIEIGTAMSLDLDALFIQAATL